MKSICKIMIVAGEASGDAHAAKLVNALRVASPETNFEFFGATGSKMRDAGVETVLDADNLAIVGLAEIARALPMFWKAFQCLKREAKARRPDVVIFVDFPDFNLKLAKSLHKQNIKTIYYISPQLWAWREYRVKTIKTSIDLLLTILPFEKDWYEKRGIRHVKYVGNPLAREVFSSKTKTAFCAEYDLDTEKPIVALLPGSRHKEIVRILPPMLETTALMAKQNPEIQFVAAAASTRNLKDIKTVIAVAEQKNLKLPATLLVIAEKTREILNAADVAAVTSGTATLETAIIGVPMAIVYKTSALNYALLRPLITVEHFGLINLIARERLAKEFIQNDFTPQILAAELFRLLELETNLQTRQRLKEVTDTLGKGGASKRAAEAILKLLQNQK